MEPHSPIPNRENNMMDSTAGADQKRSDRSNWCKHSFQIHEDVLKRFMNFADTLGVKKYEALEEALNDYFAKHGEVVEKIQQIKKGHA